jgi:Zn/Cd-binding protein ZinT
MKLIFLVIFSLIYKISNLMVGLDKLKSFCLNKEVKVADTLQGSFVCTGEQEDLLYVSIKNKQGEIVYNNTGLSNKYDYKGDFSVSAQPGNYTYCFESKAKTDLIVSFDIYTLKESGHIINLVTDDKMGEIYKNVTTLSYLFEEMDKNMKYYAERRTTHSKIVHDIIATVKEMSLYKMIIMFLVFSIHIYLLKKFFANAKVESNI